MQLPSSVANSIMSAACLLAVAVGGTSLRADSNVPKFASTDLEFFEKEVRPVLVEHCYACHSAKAKKLQAGLMIDSRTGVLTGGDSGPAAVLGDIDKSLLVQAVRYENYEMPPKGKLDAKQIAAFEKWVELGLPWPEEAAPISSPSPPTFDLEKRKSEHWVWQPIVAPEIPSVQDAAWPRTPIDRFILARLEAEQLEPAPDASRQAVVRRLYFDLIGLPPTPEQAVAASAEPSTQAMEKLVDELLESPQFGERWGRHWLDLVRYAETRGHEFDYEISDAWQYRDYVIRALNADVPYDQFVREHIAGDLLTKPRLNPEKGFNESILGTGFWFLGEWVHSPVDTRKDESDRFDNMIDVMSKAFLGVTVSCARCHDHKFDAISTKDYYSLCGFLQSSDYRQVPFEALEKHRDIAAQLAGIDRKYRKLLQERAPRFEGSTFKSEPLSPETARTIVVDYDNLPGDQFIQDGFIFGDGPKSAGTLDVVGGDQGPRLITASENSAVNDPFWDVAEPQPRTDVKSSKLDSLPRPGRTLRTATFLLTNGKLACRVYGEGHVVACVDSHRMIVGPLHGETVKAIERPKGHDSLEDKAFWVEMKLDRYVGHRIHLEFTPKLGSKLGVLYVTQGANGDHRIELEKREAAIADRAAAEAGWLSKVDRSIAQAWAAERLALQKQVVRDSVTAIAMLDGTGEDDRVLIRGNSSKPGETVPRRFLAAVVGDNPMSIAGGSGRLELAEAVNHPKNPLTARVIVNRVWHHLMGRGIVPTTDDFGVLGQRPTHPALLDYLATQFVADGQSLKKLIRRIVLSRAYQMSSRIAEQAVAKDPTNRNRHHFPMKRLEGEAIRDAILVASGELDDKMFGEPVPVFLNEFMDGRGKPKKSGPLDGDGRRSIYVAVRRNFLSPFMLAFDTPTPFSCMGRRNSSNVPAQALIMMNDPFVVDQASRWAKRILSNDLSDEERIDRMYLAAFARRPTAEERGNAMDFVAAESSIDAQTRWTDLAHALFNTKEFIFVP